MTDLTDVTPKTQYTAAGGETTFDFDFWAYAAEHLVVLETTALGVASTLSEGTDYTISGLDVAAGGTITLDGTQYPSGAIAGNLYTLYRDIPIETVVEFATAGNFLAENVNLVNNLMIGALQQLERDISNCLRTRQDSALGGVVLEDEVISLLSQWNNEVTVSQSSLPNLSLWADTAGGDIDVIVKGSEGDSLSVTNYALVDFNDIYIGDDSNYTKRVPITANLTADIPALASFQISNGNKQKLKVYLLYNTVTEVVDIGFSLSYFDEYYRHTVTTLSASSTAGDVLYAAVGSGANWAISLIGELQLDRTTNEWDAVDDVFLLINNQRTKSGVLTLTSGAGCYAATEDLTVRYTRVGNSVTLTFGEMEAAPNGSSDVWFEGLPVELWPIFANLPQTWCSVINGGSYVQGHVMVNYASGKVYFGIDYETDGNFSTSGNKGVAFGSITYQI